jgi:hypothetical protein
LVVAFFFFQTISANAQGVNLAEPRVWGGEIGWDGTQCETTKAELNLLAEVAGKDKSVIAIASLGRKESSRKLNRRRLGGLRSFLEGAGGLPQNRLIAAEGERVSGLGRIDIYVGGKLFLVFKMGRNKDLWKGCG